jgi:chromosome partitioning protein
MANNDDGASRVETTVRLASMPPLQALGVLKGNFDALVSQMRKVSAPPLGISRIPLSVKTAEAAKLLGRSPSFVRQAATDLGLGRDAGEDLRTYTPADITKIRQAKEVDPLPSKGTAPFVLVVFNQKGGVGKTTTSSNLVQDLASRGYRILIIDMDPQASMTSSWLLQDETGQIRPQASMEISLNDTAAPILVGEVDSFDSLIKKTHWPNVDIVPSHPDLSEGGLQMVELLMKKEYGFWVSFSDACKRLSTDQYDLVVVDTAPSLWLDAVEIALAADGLLIPVPARNLDIESCRSFVHTMEKWLSQLNEKYTINMKWLRFMMTQRQSASASEAKNEALLKTHLGPLLMTGRVPRMEALERSTGAAPSIYEVPPPHPKSAGRSAQEARAGLRIVHDEILELIATAWN